jgi:hypothetical protein
MGNLHAGKNFENRTWQTSYRGEIVIHTGKKIDKEGVDYLRLQGIDVPMNLPTSCFLGTVEIVDCIRFEKIIKAEYNRLWCVGPYCWKLCNPKPFDNPVYEAGQLGIFVVDTAPWEDKIIIGEFK